MSNEEKEYPNIYVNLTIQRRAINRSKIIANIFIAHSIAQGSF